MRPPDVSRCALAVWARNGEAFLNTWLVELIWPLMNPLFSLFALGFGLGAYIGMGAEYLAFIAPGLLVIFPMWSAAGEAGWGTYFRMENDRTVDAILATPATVDDVVTGEVLWAATRGLLSTLYVLGLVALFGAVRSPWAVLVPLSALLPNLLFASVALCNTALARSLSSLNYFFALFVSPQFWLSGAFFPLEALPAWAQAVAWWLPATHAVALYRGLVEGSVGWGLLGEAAWLAGATLLFYGLALAGMRRRLGH